MNPFKLVRKLGRALRGGATFRQIVLGVFLGFAAGMVPGFNLTLVLVLALLLVLNTNGGLALLAFGVGKGLCLLLAPVTFALGHFLVHTAGLAGLVRAAAQTPVVALLDLDRYALLGGLPVTVVLGGALAWGAAWLIVRAREASARAAQASPRMQRLAGNALVRALMRLAFGGRAKPPTGAAARLFVRSRLIAGAVLVVLLVGAYLLLVDALVERGLEAGLAHLNGAEVNIGSAQVSLFAGRLVLEDVQVTDPARPERNRVQAARLEADLSVRALLTRRLVVDSVVCETMRLDEPRDRPGTVYVPAQEAAPDDEAAGGILPGVDLGELGGKARDYLRAARRVQRLVNDLEEFLGKGGPAPPPGADEQERRREAAARGYLARSARDVVARQPTWVVREAHVRDLKVVEGVPTLAVEGRHLSSNPDLYGQRAELRVKLDQEALDKLRDEARGSLKDALMRHLPGVSDNDDEDGDEEEGEGAVDQAKDAIKGLLGR